MAARTPPSSPGFSMASADKPPIFYCVRCEEQAVQVCKHDQRHDPPYYHLVCQTCEFERDLKPPEKK